MTYDFFGACDADGPTAPHSPLTSYAGIPQAGFNSADAIAKLKAKGVPATKLLLGIGFYGRGWTGVTQSAPGGTATGAAPGTYEAGIEDYKVLKNVLPGHRHHRRHGLRALRQQLVELRHPGDDRREDDLGQEPGPGRRVLLGVQRRHRQRRAGERDQQRPAVATVTAEGDGAHASDPGPPSRTSRLRPH